MKFIHLLYVPTMACNMACKYCYLEDNTKDLYPNIKPVDTLKYTIDKLKSNNIIPFNISLHGGEVTTLSKSDFYDLIEYIYNYYKDNKDLIESNGFKVGSPHIKTNMYNLSKHIDTIKKFNVSISGSLDLPFSLHDKYRVTKDNKSTLNTILDNIKLLDGIPNKKKISSTIFKEHYEKIDEIIKDIKWLNDNTCLDMNDFNIMIGFDYNSNGLLHPMSESEQVDMFKRLHDEFDGTNLDAGVKGAWFNEFGPEYCTNCTNCGSKFFLLEKNGDIYSCVRGQKHKSFYYGNIYKDDVNTIMNNALNKILIAHENVGFNDECFNCKYLYICKTGCPFVKNIYKSNKSYTCKLQQELYKKRCYEIDPNPHDSALKYLTEMHPELVSKYSNKIDIPEDNTNLLYIINHDKKLKYIYDSNVFILDINGISYNLSSQIIKTNRDIIYITDDSIVNLYIKTNIFKESTDYPNNNSLYIMILSGDMISYGDEGRLKQRHIMTHQIYLDVLKHFKSDKKGYYKVNITDLIKLYKNEYSNKLPNNMFFTTSALRDYHYLKQKNNAYYHISAINLPFQNIEFYYIGE